MARATRTLEWVLLVSGLLLIGIYVGARVQSTVLSQAEVERFKNQISVGQELNGGTEAVGKKPDFTLWSSKRIQGYQESLAAHFSPALALLRVPRINLEVPILEGTDDLSLNRAVGHIVGTPKPGEDGNVGIAGHRDGFFRGLKDVTAGDVIELVTPDGIRRYVIDEITVVDPKDVSVLAARSKPTVTLVTCYPFYFIGSAPQRYVVKASLMDSPVTKVEVSNRQDF
jgi:sortase A